MVARESDCCDALRSVSVALPQTPSRTASFKTVERQLREGELQRTSKLSAFGLTLFGELIQTDRRENRGWRLLLIMSQLPGR